MVAVEDHLPVRVDGDAAKVREFAERHIPFGDSRILAHVFEALNRIHTEAMRGPDGAASLVAEIALAYQFVEQAAYDQGDPGGFDLTIAAPLMLAREHVPESYRGLKGERVYGQLAPLGLASEIAAAHLEGAAFVKDRSERRRGRGKPKPKKGRKGKDGDGDD